MLFPAYTKQEELKDRFAAIVMDPYYKYYHISYITILEPIDNNFWNKVQLVSLDKNDEVCGYFCAGWGRPENNINTLHVVNFDKNNSRLFASDINNFFKYLFIELGIKKINFNVAVGNPAEKHYDSIIKKLNGRVVGTKKYDCLVNGKYHDLKLYEIINNYWKCNYCDHRTMWKNGPTCKKCNTGTMEYNEAF